MDICEKLVKLLSDIFKNTYHSCVLEGVAGYLVDNGVTVQEWIPVSEPPKEDGAYLVCGPTLNTCVKDFTIDEGWIEFNSLMNHYCNINNSVSHWMTLPERKKENNNGQHS